MRSERDRGGRTPRRRPVWLAPWVGLVAILSACGGERAQPPPSVGQELAGVRPSQARFQFLPPLAPAATGGALQRGLSPTVKVTDQVTGVVVAAWSTSGGTYGAAVTEGADAYEVVWETGRSSLTAGRTYRITVGLAGETLDLGAVEIVASASGGRRQAGGPVAVVVGRDLPIKFWIGASAVYCLDAPRCATWCVAVETPGGTWRARAAPPTDSDFTAPYFIGAAEVGGTLYTLALQRLPIGGGNTFQKVAAYEAALDAWSMPAGIGSWAGEGNWGFGLSAMGGEVYRVGGFWDHAPSGSVSVYDPASAEWRHPSSLGYPGRELLATAALAGRVYAVGGDTFLGPTDAVESYAPGEASWTIETPLPEPALGLGAAAVAGKLYAVGGAAPGNLLEYDPTTRAWTARADMPTSRSRLAAAAFGGKVHAIGGWSYAEGFSLTHEAYDPATDTWGARAPLLPLGAAGPGQIQAGMHATAIGCHLYVIANGTLQEYSAPRL
jgi:Kelch motif protein